MSHNNKPWRALLGAAILWGASGTALAQDEAAAAEAAPEAAAEAPKPVIKPRPAEMMPLAQRAMMLDVTNTGSRLIAVGEHGIILASNNGRQWAQVASPVRAALTGVSFGTPNDGWIVGHDATILHTADGGKTWELQNFAPDLERPLLHVMALDANNAFAVGAYGMLKRTTDGGKTWVDLDAPEIRENELHFNRITKLNNGALFIAGEQGTLGVSTDGGTTWKKLASPYEGSYFGALPVGEKGALTYGLRGNLYFSADVTAKKLVWTKVDPGTLANFYGANLLNDGRPALVGLNGEVRILDLAAGTSTQQPITHLVVDANGDEKEDVVTSTFTALVPFGDGLVLTGEQGIKRLAKFQ